MQNSDLYSNAHLVVAAIRIFTHKNSKHPSMNEICKTLSFSLEQGNLICKKLKDLGIIDVVEGAFENHLFIKNHLKIEEIPRDKKEDRLEDALKKFKDSKKIKYLGLNNKDFIIYQRKKGCPYYDQYEAYADADAIILIL